jgi:hypothetical protein
MRIEFLEHTSEGPVILLWGDEPAAVGLLRQQVGELAREGLDEFAVHDLPGFEALDGCRLTFALSRRDRGVHPAEDGGFVCQLRSVWWENVEGLLEPFCQPRSGAGHQFLDYGWSTDIGLVLSTAREW